MRLFATILIAVLIIGGTWMFVNVESNIKRQASTVVFHEAKAKTSIEILRSFDCKSNVDFDQFALSVKFEGNVIHQNREPKLPASTTVAFDLDEVKEGKNSISVYANVAQERGFGDSAPTLKTMLIKVLYDSKEISREVFVSDDDFSRIGGDVLFFVPFSDHQGHAH